MRKLLLLAFLLSIVGILSFLACSTSTGSGHDDSTGGGPDDDAGDDTTVDDTISDDTADDNARCVPSILASDGFESYPIDTSPGAPWQFDGSAQVTTEAQASGRQALWFQGYYPGSTQPFEWMSEGFYPWPVTNCPVVWFEIKAYPMSDTDLIVFAINSGLYDAVFSMYPASDCFQTMTWKKFSARFDYFAGTVSEFCDDEQIFKQKLPNGVNTTSLQVGFWAGGSIDARGIESPGVVIDDFLVYDEGN